MQVATSPGALPLSFPEQPPRPRHRRYMLFIRVYTSYMYICLGSFFRYR